MKVLFVSIPCYEYINKIKEQIEKQYNADVDMFIVDPKEKMNILQRFINKLTRERYACRESYRQQNLYFSNIESSKYDYIFVLVGRGLLEPFKHFIEKHTESKKILYLWDDARRVENFSELKKLFDEIVSSDDLDCKKYGFRFLPLFYLPEYEYAGESKKIDMSFTGSWHSDRIQVLDKIRSTYPDYNYNFFVTIEKATYWGRRLTKKIEKKPDYVKFYQLSASKSANVLKASKAVIDLPHASQSGLSMRTFEALASQTKLITSNVNVKKYDFYNTNNILIIDRDNPEIPNDFFDKEYIYNEKIVKQYSIEAWIKKLIG